MLLSRQSSENIHAVLRPGLRLACWGPVDYDRTCIMRHRLHTRASGHSIDILKVMLVAPLFLLVQAGVAVVLRMALRASAVEADSAVLLLLSNTMSMLVAGGAVAWLSAVKLPGNVSWRPGRSDVHIALRLAFPTVLIMLGTQALVSMILVALRVEPGLYGEFAQALYAIPLPLALMGVAIIPGIVEEYVFRSVIQQGLSPYLRPLSRIVLSAALFGLVHILPIQMISAGIIGISLGYIRYRSGSLLPAIWGHAVANALVLIIQPDLTGTVSAPETAALSFVVSGVFAVAAMTSGIVLFERSCVRLSEQR
ncbi:MAG: CPBP family intramembrane metalloprotease [Spirochaetaceae bacterium]|nr:MAG: CPBP family intramembrane metalloprotease [Spirochaetaceae bacterium]